jgi:hypothetical protein
VPVFVYPDGDIFGGIKDKYWWPAMVRSGVGHVDMLSNSLE